MKTEQVMEITLECSSCEGFMVVKVSENGLAKDLFQPCAACKVLKGDL